MPEWAADDQKPNENEMVAPNSDVVSSPYKSSSTASLMPSPSFERIHPLSDPIDPQPPAQPFESPVRSSGSFSASNSVQPKQPSPRQLPMQLSPSAPRSAIAQSHLGQSPRASPKQSPRQSLVQSPMGQAQTPRQRRSPSHFASPVNLPIRSVESPVTSQPESSSSAIKQNVASPTATTEPLKLPMIAPHASPRRSFYSEKSVPIAGEDGAQQLETPKNPSQLTSDIPTSESIFDDNDQRLPPPEDSPSHLPPTEADVVAISSPEMQGPHASGSAKDGYVDHDDGADLDKDFEEDFNYVSEEESQANASDDENIVDYGQYIDMNPHDLEEAIPHVLRVPLSPDQNPQYPAPIPTMLMRPPKLSQRHHSRSASLNSPPPPDWSHSPTSLDEHEFVTTTIDGQMSTPFDPSEYEQFSDVESDRATIESDDRDDLEDADNLKDGDDKSVKKKKKHKWSRNPFKPKTENEDETQDEMGEAYDEQEAKLSRQQMAVIDDDSAFSRLDPETVQRHAQMFNAGGLHSSIMPRSGGPTSLIEESEIRKAGKRVQRQVFFREIAEMERQRQEDSAKTNWVHPASIDPDHIQPTLSQMQYMAEQDYKSRVNWHTRAINHNYIQEHANETLAQRRARSKAQKQQQASASMNDPAQETSAQRRARLRREKLANSGTTSSYSVQTGNSITGVS